MTADGWIPDDWTFRNAGVVSRFDDHVRETLPWYDLATHGVGEIIRANAEEFSFEEFDVAVLFLVLMFVPVPERRPLLDRLKERLRPGGAILVVDKFPLPPGYLGSSMYRWTLKQKQSGGISMEEIAEKELSLVGRQRPVVPGLFDGFVEWLRVGEFRGLIHTGADT
jgi:tRNA (cmo5U34)-methyltransferase